MEDNRDPTKIAGPQYDASLDKMVPISTSTENPEKTEETSRKPITLKEVDTTGNNNDYETVNPPHSETNDKEGHRSDYNEKTKFHMRYLDTILENYDKRAWPTYGTSEFFGFCFANTFKKRLNYCGM